MSRPQFFVPSGYGELMRDQFHYSQAVKIGNRIETSGQGGWYNDFSFPATITEEIVNAFDNLTRVLEMAGANWSHVVHINSYHVPMCSEALAVMVEQFRARMPNQPPIWTCLGVPALGDHRMRVEIRATAALGD